MNFTVEDFSSETKLLLEINAQVKQAVLMTNESEHYELSFLNPILSKFWLLPNFEGTNETMDFYLPSPRQVEIGLLEICEKMSSQQ